MVPATVTKLWPTCAVNIYYKKNHVLGVGAHLIRQFGAHRACDIRLAVPEVINISSSQLVNGDWIAIA